MYKQNNNGTQKPALKKLSRKYFQELSQMLPATRKVHLLTVSIPFCSQNGFVLSLGKPTNLSHLIVINLWSFRFKRNQSDTLSLFYLFSAIAHEINHIKLLQDWCYRKTISFKVLFSDWIALRLSTALSLERIIRSFFTYKEFSTLGKKRYAVSSVELLCFQFGFQKAYDRFSSTFNQQERELAQTILTSIQFLNRHIEIDYYSGKQAYNRFTHSLHYLHRAALRKREIVEQYPQLLCLLTPEGLLKSPGQLFQERTEDTKEFIDYVLVRMFITLLYDWDNIFATFPDLYKHICFLSNQYCADAIDYLKSSHLGEIFVHQSILQDNAAMLIKNVNTLNHLMAIHHIPHTTGSVLPLYYSDDFTKGAD